MQRKVFRIEQMLDSTRERAIPARAADKPQNIGRELAQMRDTIVRNKRELMNLHGGANEPRMIRAAFELGAAIDGMEKATQTILKSTEAIDESAKTLAVTLQSGYEHGLAQEIQEQTVRIYEACNFQDLAGQRIGKAIAALQTIEEHVTRMLAQWDEIATAAPAAAPTCEPTLINGPKLDGDKGHATQRDIDAMFG